MSVFSPDGKLYKALVFIRNILVLNLLWLLFSLPVITIGAATEAAFYVALKLIDGTEGYMFKTFWKGFKDNWKNGTILWIITAAAGYAVYLDIQLLLNSDDPSFLLILISIVSIVFVVFSLLYAYPLAARYDNKWLNHMKNSFIMCIRYFKKTVFLLLIIVIEVGILIWNEKMLILVVLLGPMILFYTIAGTSRKLFRLIDKQNEEERLQKEAEEAKKALESDDDEEDDEDYDDEFAEDSDDNEDYDEEFEDEEDSDDTEDFDDDKDE